MRNRNPYQSAIVPAILLAFSMGPAVPSQAEGNAWLDPGMRHSNGIPFASTDPLRTNSVSWQCNPDNLGYCGGHYYRPCIDSLRFHRLRDAAHGVYTPMEHRRYQPHGGCGCVRGEVLGGMDGIEPAGLSTLGQLHNDMLAPGGVPAGLPSP